MIKEIKLENDYLYLPIQREKEERIIEIFYKDNNAQKIKIMEFMVPIGEDTDGVYSYDYQARFPVKQFTDKTLILTGDVPEAFMKEVYNASFIAYEPLRRPAIHFTAKRGWINDPNGLIYHNGYYHLYFQYNPCNTKWNNMCWGHAVSKDLLHWEQKDTVLIPDEDGMIFSGCALANQRGMLGLSKDAILFYYSAAGDSNLWSKNKAFTQKVAYSLDQGETLIKTGLGELGTICKESRDPKVFWHEESRAYIMCLWLEMNDFAILRSTDLLEWSITDRLTFEKAWECPDLVKVPTEDGQGQWMFACADGYYYWGEFDGYRFTTDGRKHYAYINKLLYAAQTYSGLSERVVSVSWIRSRNATRLYKGCMGLPRELSVITYQGEKYLSQQPIRELAENSTLIYEKMGRSINSCFFMQRQEEVTAFLIEMLIDPTSKSLTVWNISGLRVSYDATSGILTVDKESFMIGKNVRDFSFLLDDDIFEVSANCGIILGAFEIPETKLLFKADTKQYETFRVYQIN